MNPELPRLAPESPRLRLLVIYEGYGRYGTALMTRTLLGALGPHIDATMVAGDVATAEWVAADRPGTATVAMRPVRGWSDVRAMGAYRRLITRVRPDVVHLAFPTPEVGTRYLALVAKSVPGVRTVAVEHSYGIPSRAISRIPKRVSSAALDAHVAVGIRVARTVEENFGLRRGSIRAIYGGASPRVPTEVDRVDGETVVGTVARLSPEKGVDDLLLAIADVPGVSLVVVGDGPERTALEKLAGAVGVAERAHFVGYTPQPENHLSGLDLFVLPSRHDAMGIAILEAMAAGLPVVASDVGSVSEAVVDGETGVLVPVDDVPALRDAIARLVDDRELRERMGAAGRARYETTFTSAKMAAAYEALYNEVVAP